MQNVEPARPKAAAAADLSDLGVGEGAQVGSEDGRRWMIQLEGLKRRAIPVDSDTDAKARSEARKGEAAAHPSATAEEVQQSRRVG